MQKVADLHVHTSISDSTFSPEKVVEYAKAKGLDAIAITDHDSCQGIEPALSAAEHFLEIIPGVELTAEMAEQEAHILGYFINWQDTSFLKKLEEICDVRKKRALEILKKLRDKGIDISDMELFEASNRGSVGRLHIAQLMHKKGIVASASEAFKKYIGNNGPCYVERFKLSPKEAINMIRCIGGVSVLAHPKNLDLKEKSMDDILKGLINDGIQGIEVFHSDHTDSDSRYFKELAKKYNLLLTGGSDCHGLGKKDVLLGRVKVPYELVEKLRYASQLML